MGNWPGPAGDARPYSGGPSPTGSYHFQKKTVGPPVDLQDGRPYPPGRDGRDYRTPGPWRPDGTVGNTEHNQALMCAAGFGQEGW